MSNRRRREQPKMRHFTELEVPTGSPWPKPGGMITVSVGEATVNAHVVTVHPTERGTLLLVVRTPVPVPPEMLP